MPQIFITQLGLKKFRVVTEGFPQSAINLDFSGFSLKDSDLVIHHRAQPKENRSLWTWGVYSPKEDNYFSTFNLLVNGNNLSSCTLETQTRSDDLLLLPSHILIVSNAAIAANAFDLIILTCTPETHG